MTLALFLMAKGISQPSHYSNYPFLNVYDVSFFFSLIPILHITSNLISPQFPLRLSFTDSHSRSFPTLIPLHFRLSSPLPNSDPAPHYYPLLTPNSMILHFIPRISPLQFPPTHTLTYSYILCLRDFFFYPLS